MTKTSTIHIILNIISLIATILGLLISFLVLTTALLRRKLFGNVPLLLCANNYLLVFSLGVIEFLHNITTLRGDFGLVQSNKNMSICRLKAYFIFSLISAVYMGCILQVNHINLKENCLYFPQNNFVSIFRLSFVFVV